MGQFKKELPYVMNCKMKLSCAEYTALHMGISKFVAARRVFQLLQGCVTFRTTVMKPFFYFFIFWKCSSSPSALSLRQSTYAC